MIEPPARPDPTNLLTVIPQRYKTIPSCQRPRPHAIPDREDRESTRRNNHCVQP